MSSKSTGRIWIDLTHLLQWEGRFTGIERVEYQLAKRFADHPNAHFFAYNEGHRAFYELPAETLEQFANGEGGAKASGEVEPARITFKQRFMPRAKRLVPARLRRMLKRRLLESEKINAQHLVMPHPFAKGDVVFIAATFSDIFFLKNLTSLKKQAGFKLVHLVHDIIPIVRPNYVGEWDTGHFKTYYGHLLRYADGILAVSQSTKRDLEAFCKDNKIKAPAIDVVREGDDFKQVKNPLQPEEITNGEKFVLCVGTFEVRKNYTLLYYAYKQAHRAGIKLPKLVIAGRAGWLTEDIRQIMAKDPDTAQSIMHLTNITDRKLAWLYQNCLFTVQPSFYEGWGLPVAESLYYGKLCLSSDTSSMPEIGGDLVEYFSPFDSNECMQKLAHFSANSKELKQREQRIKREYKMTSWDDTFDQTQRFLARIAK